MSRALIVEACGPGTTVQDQGRLGYLVQGLSQAGAADQIALFEGAALLGQSPELAALELAGMGGTFRAQGDLRIAMTGAPMAASIDGAAVVWNASHALLDGQVLTIGSALTGNYGYLHVGGGIAADVFLGSRSTHLVAQVGAAVTPGALPVGPDHSGVTGQKLVPRDRFGGGTVRIIPSAQTALFADSDLLRLENTAFARDPRGNRMGAAMNFDGPPFKATDQLNILSEMVVPGDIQVTGDGTPFVLLYECQTTGGYPRIGTVIPPDLPRIAQARAGEPIRFQFITRDQALAVYSAHLQKLRELPQATSALVRNPHDIRDLLSYQLISGAITGEET